jgi:hypothetical protein
MVYTLVMFQIILITHIVIGVVTIIATAAALYLATSTSAIKYLYALAGGLSLQVLSGVYMAFLSQTVTAIGLCQNLGFYTIIVGIGCVSMYIKSEKIEFKQYLYMAMPAIASYSVFVLAIIKKI